MRNPKRGTRQLLALVLTVLLCWTSVSRAATVTPRGVQCPTAAVQEIVVAKRDCCNRIVGVEVRKPREGEKGFVQCRCAEKKSAQHGAAEPTVPRVEAMCAIAPIALTLPVRLPELQAEDYYLARLTTVVTPPLLLPPQSA